MAEKIDKKKLAEFIFDTLDLKGQGFLQISEIDEALSSINETNQKIVKKYLSWYKSKNNSEKISRSMFIDLILSRKKEPVVVHIKLCDLLINENPVNISRTFSQRLKRRLDIDKFKTHMQEPTEALYTNLKDCCQDANHCEKPRWKSAKQRNLEELLSIRRCHLLYS